MIRLPHVFPFLGLALLSILLSRCTPTRPLPGLIGALYGESDLHRWKDSLKLTKLSANFDTITGHGKSWSAKWQGQLEAPADGEITFLLETDQVVDLTLDKNFIKASRVQPLRTGKILMKKGQLYPIEIRYQHADTTDGFFSIKWKWLGKSTEVIPAKYLSHSSGQEKYWNWANDKIFLSDKVSTIPVISTTVYKEEGHFAGWPANGGIWSWGDEILVSFVKGTYQKNDSGSHSMDKSEKSAKVFARSLDGGKTWLLEESKNPLNDESDAQNILTEKINFLAAGFAFHANGKYFHFSYDKGKTWKGPFYLNQPFTELTARTDYLVENRYNALLFLSAKQDMNTGDSEDRAYTAKTSDGGKTITFVSWMTEEPFTSRSVMPATVRLTDNHLISALRRRKDVVYENRPDESKNWIDVYESLNNGISWKFLHKIAETGIPNGNPPSMVMTKDGKLCLVYGVRSAPFGIRTRISKDAGKTWTPEIHLRDDGLVWDIGYCRSVVRNDGKIVTVYYYATKQNPQQHIDATIWDPSDL